MQLACGINSIPHCHNTDFHILTLDKKLLVILFSSSFITTNEQTARQLMLSRGVYTTVVDSINGTDDFYKKANDLALASGFAVEGDVVVMVAGVGVTGTTNMFKVHTLTK